MNFILAAVTQRPFLDEAGIKEVARAHVARATPAAHGRPGSLLADGCRAVLIYTSETEQTWIVVDGFQMLCLADDRRLEKARIKLLVKREDAFPIRVDNAWSRDSGLVYFGNRANGWLFSKKLFTLAPVDEVLTSLIRPSEVASAPARAD